MVVSIILVTSFLPNMWGFYRRHGGVRHPGDFVSTEHGGCPSCCSRVDVVVDGKCINAKRNDVLHDVKMLNVSAQLEGHDMM